MAIPIDFINEVFPTALVPYNKTPLIMSPNTRSFVTYNSLVLRCSIRQCLNFLKLT